MANPALILEGGGMRGIFTAGVLDFFLDAGFRFPSVLGVSAGACHACSFLAGQRGRAYETVARYLDDKRYCSLYSLVTTGDLFGAKMLYETIPRELYPIDNDAFLKHPVRFQAVVTNCLTGRAEYPEVRDLLEDLVYVRASSSLPAVSRMVPIKGGLYLDGGIADSIPLLQSMRQGNRKNVVVLTRHREYRKEPNSLMPLLRLKYRRYPELVHSLETRHVRYNDALHLVKREEEQGNALVIAPAAPLDLGRIEKDRRKLRAVYEQGYAAAKRQEDALRAFLET